MILFGRYAESIPCEIRNKRLLSVLIRIYHRTRLVFSRRHHHLGRNVLELGEVVALDVLELDLQHPRLRPFAVGTEPHVAEHRRKGVGAEVVGELGIVEALGPACWRTCSWA